MDPVELERWSAVSRLLRFSGPFALDGFEADVSGAGVKHLALIRPISGYPPPMKVLVVGAGGLGCEILKDLALSGFGDLHVIDMDTIDLSNLNRQFLFRQVDVGQSKAEVAARFITSRIPGVAVTPHFCKLQDKPHDFYRQFRLCVAGLDSIEARRFLNSVLLSLVEYDEHDAPLPDSIIPLIDGGTEAWKGQARIILPTLTACFECTLDLFPPQRTFQICTITNTPRQPEHCIEWARVVRWPQVQPFGNDAPDMDRPEHLQWMFETASARALEFHIPGVTLSGTKGVVKNIIPAIASTNAIIAAACCNEALKLATGCADNLDNYFFYAGSERVYSYSFQYAKREDCLACGGARQHLEIAEGCNVADLLEAMRQSAQFQFKMPSVRSMETGKLVYMSAPQNLEEQLRPNLQRALQEFVGQGGSLEVGDPSLGTNVVEIVVSYKKNG